MGCGFKGAVEGSILLDIAIRVDCARFSSALDTRQPLTNSSSLDGLRREASSLVTLTQEMDRVKGKHTNKMTEANFKARHQSIHIHFGTRTKRCSYHPLHHTSVYNHLCWETALPCGIIGRRASKAVSTSSIRNSYTYTGF